ncbi:MAG: hypothetical protein WC139_02155 [Candidatus Kapaibacterium sp.]
MRDFRLANLKELIEVMLRKEYNFILFKEFERSNSNKVIILRHDVDLLPKNSLAAARLENSIGIQGTYYFRIISQTFKPDIIKEILDLGHEIGYHYEDVDLVLKKDKLTIQSEKDKKRVVDLAFESFCENLEKLRKIVPISTVCMHGSPRAKYDNKMIWEKYDYRELGIVGEPYFDVDWNEFGYLTDTGRRWNGDKYSIRDKVNSKYKFDFKTTDDIVRNVDKLPGKMMITVHPQRWTDDNVLWVNELVWQNVKNVVKRVKVRSLR